MKVIRELPKNSAGPPPDLSRTGGSEAMCVNSCSLGLRMRNFLRSGSEGAAILEFALVLPLLLLLLTGIFSVTMALITYEKIGEAAFVGAQVFQNDRGMLGATGDPCAAAQTQTATVLSGWNSSLITYTVAITDAAGTAHSFGPASGSSFTCSGLYADLTQSEPVVFTVSYQYTWIPMYAFNLGTGTLTQARAVSVE